MPSFPLIPPISPSASDLKLTPNNIVGENESPFTYSQQIFEYPGDRWEAELALPAMSRAQAEPWLAFLSALRGKTGTFLLGDPNGAPQGSAGRSNVNLLKWSEDFTNGVWAGAGAGQTTTAGFADPFGGTNACSMSYDGAHDNFLLQSSASTQTLTNGVNYVSSVWLRVPSGTLSTKVTLRTGAGVLIQTNAITVTTTWTRFSVVGQPTDGTGQFVIAGFNTLLGIGAGSLQIFGAVMELGSSPSTYIGTSFGSANGGPQISINGTTQGPKFVLLKGLAPNSVAFKAGDYIECGYGLAATRITTSGGAGATKYLYSWAVNPSVSGQRYVTSIRLRNIGTKTVVVADDLGMNVSVAPGTEAVVSGASFGDGSTPYGPVFTTSASASDALDFVAWAPRSQRQGLDENLIPVVNQNFTGWNTFSGSAVALVQGYNRRLYKVLSDSTSDAKGNCGVDIFPRWRAGDAVADGDPVNVFSPKGLFRLSGQRASPGQIDNAICSRTASP
jgi:hypothetical protein